MANIMASDILREQSLRKGKTPQDSAEVAALHSRFIGTPGLTLPLRNQRFIESLGDSVPYYLQEVETNAELPTIEVILDKLGYSNDNENMNGGRTAFQKFLDDFPKDMKKKEKDIKKEWGNEGWDYVKQSWKQAQLDKMKQDINEGYAKKLLEGDSRMSLPIVGNVDLGDVGKAISGAGGYAMKFFTPRRYEAFSRGEDPTWKDNLGDAVESGLMAVPATSYSKVLGVVPKVGKVALKNKAVSNIIGNMGAPFLSEAMDAAMRDENDPNVDRQDFSLGDALMGTATNLGVNFGLARSGGGAGRLATGELTRSGQGGIMGKVREQIGNFGKSRSERGLGPALPIGISKRIPVPASLILDEALDVAGSAAPTLLVNRYGKDKDANLALNMASGILSAMPDVPNLANEIKDVRAKEHREASDRKTKKEVEGVKMSNILDLDKRDIEYLDAVANDPSIMQFGYAPKPDDFKLWLLERGHKLLANTGAHRPLWEVKVDNK